MSVEAGCELETWVHWASVIYPVLLQLRLHRGLGRGGFLVDDLLFIL